MQRIESRCPVCERLHVSFDATDEERAALDEKARRFWAEHTCPPTAEDIAVAQAMIAERYPNGFKHGPPCSGCGVSTLEKA